MSEEGCCSRASRAFSGVKLPCRRYILQAQTAESLRIVGQMTSALPFRNIPCNSARLQAANTRGRGRHP